jgi:hypothetical protein
MHRPLSALGSSFPVFRSAALIPQPQVLEGSPCRSDYSLS